MWRLNTGFLLFLIILLCPEDGQGKSNGEIRLQDGDTQYQGRVEIYHSGEWRRVCEEGWGLNEAKVACKQLGNEDAHVAKISYSPRGTGSFWLSDLNCTGTEEGLYNCSSPGWGNVSSACDTGDYDDAGVICKTPSDGVLRLINTSNAYEGRLEIFLAGRWGRVCDYGWRLTSADVACKQLGFTGAHTPVVNTSPRGTGFFWIQNIDCQGSETSLADCSHDGVGEINSRFCVETSSNDAGVLCKGPNDGEVRLTGGNQYQGRVEIFYAGSWGIVCKVYWYTYEGQVLCRQLGFSGALQSWSDFVSRTGPRVMLDEIYCDGTESRLDNCSHGVIGYPNSFGCTGAYPHEIRAWCEAPDDGQLRLLDGNGYNSGRVEIKFAGEWRRVCDDGWGINDTAVVCRQLGYSGYVRSVRSWTPKGSGFFWLFKTGCLGTESNLTDCRYGRVGAIYSRSCDSNSYNDAGVYCQGYLPGVIPTSTTTRTTTTTVTSGPTCYSCSGTSGTSCSTSVTCSYGYVCHTTASAYESYNLFYSSSTIAYSYSRGCRSQSLCTSQELQGNTCTGTGTSKVCRQCCTSNFCNSGTLDTSQTSTNNKGFATGSAWFNVLCVLLLIVFAMN